MALAKFFRFPFGISGDRTAVPDTTQVDGSVSFETGFGVNYEQDPAVTPDAKNIPRDQTNELFYDITQSIREFQTLAFPDWIDPSQNGGAPFPYDIQAIVRYDAGAGIQLFRSLHTANTATPAAGADWEIFTSFDLAGNIATMAEAVAGTNNTKVMTPLRVAQAVPSASETTAGRVELSTTAEAQTGTDDLTAVTPLKARAAIARLSPSVSDSVNLVAVETGLNANSVITADQFIVKNSSGDRRLLTGVNVTINSSTVGANGFDTGTIPANSWLARFIIHNPSTNTTAGLLSLSATAPTLPSGYTEFGFTGYVRTDNTANKFPLGKRQLGRRSQWVVAPGGNLTARRLMATGAAGSIGGGTYAAVTTAPFVAPGASAIDVTLTSGNTVGNQAMVAENNSYGALTSNTNPPRFSTFGQTGEVAPGMTANMLLESGNIYWASSGAMYLYCDGYEENF